MTAGDPDGGVVGDPDSAADQDGADAPPPLSERVPVGLVFRWAAAATGGVLAALLLADLIYTVRAILILVLIALFIAISLDPAIRWLVRRRIPRGAAVIITMVVLVGLFALFVWSVAPPLAEQGSRLITNLPGYLGQLSQKSVALRDITDRYHLAERLNGLLAQLPATLAGGTFGFVHRLIGAIASTLTVLVLSIYFMADMPRLQRGVVSLFPPRRRTRAAEIVGVVVDKVGDYMIGNIVISIFAGVSTLICLLLLRVPFAFPLAVTMAIADLIPLVGATLGAVICTVVTALTVDVWPAAVIVLAFIIAYQQVENYFIAPRVYRHAMKMSSVTVLLVALIGGSLLGLVGALMAIPIAAVVKVIWFPDNQESRTGQEPVS
jgi:predicted PurR-regulated permease PerM